MFLNHQRLQSLGLSWVGLILAMGLVSVTSWAEPAKLTGTIKRNAGDRITYFDLKLVHPTSEGIRFYTLQDETQRVSTETGRSAFDFSRVRASVYQPMKECCQ